MKVILQQDVKGKGKKGQMIEVSEGYGRNFLIPRKLAVAATADNMNVMRQAEEAVHITAKSGTGGRLFGSVTSKEVASQLKKEHGIDIPKQKIVMKESIKSFGTFVLKVKLYPEITGNLKVQVTEE